MVFLGVSRGFWGVSWGFWGFFGWFLVVFQGCLEVSRGFGGGGGGGLLRFHWRALLPNRLQIVGERVFLCFFFVVPYAQKEGVRLPPIFEAVDAAASSHQAPGLPGLLVAEVSSSETSSLFTIF